MADIWHVKLRVVVVAVVLVQFLIKFIIFPYRVSAFRVIKVRKACAIKIAN